MLVSVMGLAFCAGLAFINLLRPALWMRLRLPMDEKVTPQREQKMLNDELYMAKCRLAGVFALIGVPAFGYSLVINVPKLF